MKLTPSQRLYGIGTILFGALFVCSHSFSARGSPSFLIPLGIAGLFYLLAIREFFLVTRLPTNVLVFGLAIAACWHAVFLRLPPGPDDDIHRYVWDGRLQRLGYNPYIIIPDAPAAAVLHTAETHTLNNGNLPSPYPPGAELFFRAITTIHESIFTMKLAFVLCDLAIVFVLFILLRLTGQAEHWVLAYAWHPLLAIEVAGSGHVDILGALLLLMSATALVRGWRTPAAVAFGLAIAVKLLPIVLMPLYWKRIRLRDAALAGLTVALLYLPFLDHGHIVTGSIGTYVHSFRFNGPLFAALDQLADPKLLAAMALLAGLLTAVWMRQRAQEPIPDGFAWPMAAALFCAPVVYPWYLLWFLPFLRSIRTIPIVIWTISIFPTYYVWHLRATGHLWILPTWVMTIEYGAVAGAMAILLSRRLRRTGPHGKPHSAL